MKRTDAVFLMGLDLLRRWSDNGNSLEGSSDVRKGLAKLGKDQRELAEAYCQHFEFDDDEPDEGPDTGPEEDKPAKKMGGDSCRHKPNPKDGDPWVSVGELHFSSCGCGHTTRGPSLTELEWQQCPRCGERI